MANSLIKVVDFGQLYGFNALTQPDNQNAFLQRRAAYYVYFAGNAVTGTTAPNKIEYILSNGTTDDSLNNVSTMLLKVYCPDLGNGGEYAVKIIGDNGDTSNSVVTHTISLKTNTAVAQSINLTTLKTDTGAEFKREWIRKLVFYYNSAYSTSVENETEESKIQRSMMLYDIQYEIDYTDVVIEEPTLISNLTYHNSDGIIKVINRKLEIPQNEILVVKEDGYSQALEFEMPRSLDGIDLVNDILMPHKENGEGLYLIFKGYKQDSIQKLTKEDKELYRTDADYIFKNVELSAFENNTDYYNAGKVKGKYVETVSTENGELNVRFQFVLPKQFATYATQVEVALKIVMFGEGADEANPDYIWRSLSGTIPVYPTIEEVFAPFDYDVDYYEIDCGDSTKDWE